MTESEFDALLRRALIDVIHEDYADILEGEPDVPPHTEKYLRRKRKLLADPIGYVRRLARPVWKKTLRMVACILLVLATLFGSVMALSPSARAWVVRMYTEWREDSTMFTFWGSQPESPVSTDWYPSTLPEGYDEVSVDTVGNIIRITYQNASGKKLYFSYRSFHNNGAFSIDNEHAKPISIEINNSTATLFVSNNTQYQSHLTWMDEAEDVAFLISGFVDSQELITTAESVKKFM